MTSKQASSVDKMLDHLQKVEELLVNSSTQEGHRAFSKDQGRIESSSLSSGKLIYRAKMMGSKILEILDKELEELQAEKESQGSSPSLRKRFRKLYQRRARARSIFNL